MKLKELEVYSGVQISLNEKTGDFFLKSPVNGTQRIFSSIEMARNYIDHCYVLDSHAMAMWAVKGGDIGDKTCGRDS